MHCPLVLQTLGRNASILDVAGNSSGTPQRRRFTSAARRQSPSHLEAPAPRRPACSPSTFLPAQAFPSMFFIPVVSVTQVLSSMSVTRRCRKLAVLQDEAEAARAAQQAECGGHAHPRRRRALLQRRPTASVLLCLPRQARVEAESALCLASL